MRLTSYLNIYFKWILPLVWIGMFWIGTILAFTGAFRDKNSEPPPFLICCVMLIITLVGTYFLIALSSGLKKVKLTENHLLVSGLFRQEIVPLETTGSRFDSRDQRRLEKRYGSFQNRKRPI